MLATHHQTPVAGIPPVDAGFDGLASGISLMKGAFPLLLANNLALSRNPVTINVSTCGWALLNL